MLDISPPDGALPFKEGGRYDFDDGGIYVGDWQETKAHGYGICTGPRCEGEYSGSWHCGFEVSGVYKWPSGAVYQGQFQNGRRHGVGVEYREKWSYKGEWTQGSKGRHGVRSHLLSPLRYEGTWANGLQDGYGSETYADGGTYQGQWQRGMRHGYGVRQSAPYGVLAGNVSRLAGSMQSLDATKLATRSGMAASAAALAAAAAAAAGGRGGFVLQGRTQLGGSEGNLQTTGTLGGQRRGSGLEKQLCGSGTPVSGRQSGGLLRGLRLKKQRSTGDIDMRPYGGPGPRSVSSSTDSLGNRLKMKASSAAILAKQTSLETGSNASFISSQDADITDPTTTETYMGEWKDDKRCGFGIAERSDGLSYIGEWFNNKKYGYGVTTYKDGRKEEGKYKNNLLVSSANKRGLFLMRPSKLRERVEAAVREAQNAQQIAMQKADIAISRTAAARDKAEQAEVRANQARADSQLAILAAKRYGVFSAADYASAQAKPTLAAGLDMADGMTSLDTSTSNSRQFNAPSFQRLHSSNLQQSTMQQQHQQQQQQQHSLSSLGDGPILQEAPLRRRLSEYGVIRRSLAQQAMSGTTGNLLSPDYLPFMSSSHEQQPGPPHPSSSASSYMPNSHLSHLQPPQTHANHHLSPAFSPIASSSSSFSPHQVPASIQVAQASQQQVGQTLVPTGLTTAARPNSYGNPPSSLSLSSAAAAAAASGGIAQLSSGGHRSPSSASSTPGLLGQPHQYSHQYSSQPYHMQQAIDSNDFTHNMAMQDKAKEAPNPTAGRVTYSTTSPGYYFQESFPQLSSMQQQQHSSTSQQQQQQHHQQKLQTSSSPFAVDGRASSLMSSSPNMYGFDGEYTPDYPAGYPPLHSPTPPTQQQLSQTTTVHSSRLLNKQTAASGSQPHLNKIPPTGTSLANPFIPAQAADQQLAHIYNQAQATASNLQQQQQQQKLAESPMAGSTAGSTSQLSSTGSGTVLRRSWRTASLYRPGTEHAQQAKAATESPMLLKRKPSLQLPSTTGSSSRSGMLSTNAAGTTSVPLSREEVSYLSIAEREHRRKEAELAQRMARNPFLFFVNAQFRNWLAEQQLILVVMIFNLALVLCFYHVFFTDEQSQH